MAKMEKFNALKSEVLKNGGFYLRFYFDMHAGNAPALQDIMVGFVGKLTNEEGVRFAVGEVDEPIAYEGLFSTTARVSMLVNDFPTLARLTINYAPIGIEIEEPTDIRMPSSELQAGLIGIAATAQELSHHILTRAMSPEEKKTFEKQMAHRAELGRRLVGEQEKQGSQ
ncbi:MAG: hypothetical protein KGH63_00625 [Candidatus Micrarchaeota archaeon]|nr:hypothetical protein [Candidatus Micrarchaeota archaeon]